MVEVEIDGVLMRISKEKLVEIIEKLANNADYIIKICTRGNSYKQ